MTDANDHSSHSMVLPAPAEGVMQATRPELDTTQDLERHESTATTAVDPNNNSTRALKDEIGPDGDVPRLHGFHLWHRKWSLLAYASFILLCNVAAPCILYYVLRDNTSLSNHTLLGIGSATLGISSSFDNPFRMWKLWKHRDLYGPLGDPKRWHMDFSMHLYSFALFPILAIPLAISSSVNPPMESFFLMSTAMLIAVPGIYFLITLFAPKANFWISSDPPGTRCKPGVFILFEDIAAVDFRHGKEFRRVLHERYNSSPVYRDLFWWVTAWWALGCLLYFGTIAGLAWRVRFGIAYGLILGLLFVWMLVWSVTSIWIASYFKKKERKWVEMKRKDPEFARRMTREGSRQLKEENRRASKQYERERRESRRSIHLQPQTRQIPEEQPAVPVQDAPSQ